MQCASYTKKSQNLICPITIKTSHKNVYHVLIANRTITIGSNEYLNIYI